MIRNVILVVFACLVLLCSADTETINGITWTYTVLNGQVLLGGRTYSTPAVPTSTVGNIVIPSMLGGKSVTSINERAFYGCGGITNVTIPDSVTSIGVRAFLDCSGLTSVTIPNSVTSVGRYAFAGCSCLTSIIIPDRVTSIGERAFYGCSGLTSVTIPDSVTSIGNEAFDGTSFYNNKPDGLVVLGKIAYKVKGESPAIVTIPDDVTIIGDAAFAGCSGLVSVTIPDSMTSIGSGAFDGTPFYNNQPDGLVVLGKIAYKIKGACPAAVTIPGDVTIINNAAFEGCKGLTCVIISNNVTRVGNSAFTGCSGLTSVTIPQFVCTNMLSSVFPSAYQTITNVVIAGGVTRIGEKAFYGCRGIANVAIPDSVTNIGSSAFYNCSGIMAVHIFDLAAWCGTSFSGGQSNPLYYGHDLYLNGSIITALEVPDGVTNIGAYTFYNCSRLTSVTIPNSVTSIGSSAFYGCSGLNGALTIGNSVTSIGSSAFSGCSGLTSVTIPNSVTSIGSSAFYGCSGLTSVTIPASATSIGSYAFFNSGLTDVIIPSRVTSIGYRAFSNCSNLTSVTIPNSVTSVREGAFSGCGGLTSFAVASGNQTYKSVSGLLLTKDGKTLVAVPGGLKKVAIPESVTKIGTYSFSSCSGLTSVAISNNVTSIEIRAFEDCSGLTSVTIPDSVTNIGQSAFYRCVSLTNLLFDGDAPAIGNSAFYGMPNCIARVRRRSTGWNVDIPSTWNGIAIDYYNLYNVAFDANGGECTAMSLGVEEGLSIDAFPEVTRTNSTFVGWFTTVDGGTKIDASMTIKEDMTLYAHWLTLEDALDVENKIRIATSMPVTWMAILDARAKLGDMTARSGAIGDRTNTWLSATVSGAGTMSFWCKVSCEHDDDNTFTWDRLMVYTNDVEVVEWRMDGETDWTRREVSFAGGENTVKWVYFKDRSISEGEDCAWVDGVTWTLADVAVDVGGGKSVMVPMDWIDAHSNIVMAVGGDKSAAMKSTAANGRKVWECYVLGLDPEKTSDFKITSFPMKSDGTPDLSAITFEPEQNQWNLSGAVPKLKGKATLDAEWQDVPPGGNPSFRFFTVEVQMP